MREGSAGADGTGARHRARVAVLALLALLAGAACGWRAGGRELERTDPADLEVFDGVEFATPEGERLLLDVYRPADELKYPAVVAVHGGGWRSGQRGQGAADAARLAQHGLVVFAPDYRLACDKGLGSLCGYSHPAAIRDLRTAILWVRANGGRYGARVDAVGLAGASAGGHLALMAATTGTPGATKGDAVVAWSGPADLRLSPSDQAVEAATSYLGCELERCPGVWRGASPVAHASSDDAPALLADFTDDRLVPLEGSRRFVDALEDAGVDTRHVVVEGSGHAFFGKDVWNVSVEWLKEHLGA